MKRLILTLLACLLLAGTAYAVEKPVEIIFEQPCVDGCPEQNIGAVKEWRIYVSDTSGVYGETPIITMPYDGTAMPSYTSPYTLVLTGTGTKYFIVRSYNPDCNPPESGNSNEADYPYNFSGTAIPVNVIFKISTP